METKISSNLLSVKPALTRGKMGEYFLDSPIPHDRYADVSDCFSVNRIHGFRRNMYFLNGNHELSKIRLRSISEGRSHIRNRAFRYFGIALVSTDGSILSSSTVWCNTAVRAAAEDDDHKFRHFIQGRRFFSANPQLSILSMQFTAKGLDVIDPTTGNVNCCNLFCLVQ